MRLYENYIKGDFSSYETFQKTFEITRPDNFNFGYDVVDRLAGETPGKLALLYTNPGGEIKRFSFGDIKRLSNQAANFFVQNGIKKGDMVLTILKRHYQYWIAAVALHKIGAVLIPASNQLTVKDLVYRINAANIKMVVCTNDGDIKQFVDEAQPQAPSLEIKAIVGGQRDGWLDFDAQLSAQSEDFPRPTGDAATTNSDPFLIYFTSGTTGYPKMAMHDQLYPLGHIRTAAFWHNIDPNGLHFTIADTGWAKASWGKIYGQWLCEGAIFVYDMDRFNAKEILQQIQTHRVTTFCVPPTMYRMLTQERMEDYDLTCLKHCTSAGEPLNPEVFRDWKNRVGLKIYDGFGQSETSVCIATILDMEPRMGSMGSPVGYDIELIDEDGAPCRIGEVGEICISLKKGKPIGLATCYYRDEELTKKIWRDGYYHTGDTAWFDEDNYLWYVGRADDIIKSSGYRIGPFEVESALLEHPAVLEAAITGVPDELRGQLVKATIVLKSGYEPSDELVKDIQAHVKRVTAPYKYPRLVDFVEALPKTISGKVRRVELRGESKSDTPGAHSNIK